ncbi:MULTISPECIES: DUF1837 domain-containing protein [unclassified Mycoplasma]|uniref:DUF1837 domain-containing protein n=1 Tax=unclassified Mycoplasma TaxID=2683645 RepID=UPI00211BFCC5|nr:MULTISPECIES: DUF1837 domain-containing protein [unclassified Mycoplasma]UUM19790.1 DUF1837 domain-containing protein [Mycoplasma sp. 1578d]UUM24774.1 DUF1837 domain-containing protein [Mycoplasma sp. 3686d]
MKTEKFENFQIYNLDNRYSFLYLDFQDEKKFISGLVSYIFNEQNLLLYTEENTGLKFEINDKTRKKLYTNISLFLNLELEKLGPFDLKEELEKIIKGEHEVFKNKDNKLLIGKDKAGKIGEYIFHLFLSKYFGYHYIIPKLKLITDGNMSVNGIDVLFYDDKKDEILFGESKVYKELKKGIENANKTLEEYEENLIEEYRIVLSNDKLKFNKLFLDKYKDKIDVCTTLNQFIKEANINSIVIPVFIAHGDSIQGNMQNNIKNFLEQLKKINQEDKLELKTKYILISFPLIDKNKFMEYAIRVAVNKSHEYK